ncbi:CaiB/BaiF CoA transferase family protein [Pontibacter beigongshangensis]|uniref:CaiB/BaiF CoA transferase family protein n=1 Tax=Pontibacter beigongshangensis TaxID=2574733 RepID=UPI00164F54B0|nr:CaiB/BaiF CoA-transferase family protein [Pontibacter beigongshangensis]
MKPLENLVVLEFCQFMAGPSAGLRLADLGARVIKIERPGKGESGRQISIKNLFSEGDGIVFHTINRNKESYAADLKSPEDLKRIKKLIEQADVMTHNFRPGVMEKIGLDYETVKAINPKIVYGVVTGYGNKGPWASKPGQDLLLQSLSGLTYLSGDKNDAPTPFGLAVADMICGAHFVQGILAALIRRGKTKTGALVEVSLLESIIDFQFEVITTYLNDGGKLPDRALRGNGHAYLSAPYGVYKTKDRHLALAMEDLDTLGATLGCYELLEYKGSDSWFVYRDDIMHKLGLFLKERTTAEWLAILEPADIWCADILNYEEFLNHAGYKALQMEQETVTAGGDRIRTTRCPIRIDGKRLFSSKPAPRVGEHVKEIERDFNLSAGYGNAS